MNWELAFLILLVGLILLPFVAIVLGISIMVIKTALDF